MNMIGGIRWSSQKLTSRRDHSDGAMFVSIDVIPGASGRSLLPAPYVVSSLSNCLYWNTHPILSPSKLLGRHITLPIRDSFAAAVHPSSPSPMGWCPHSIPMGSEPSPQRKGGVAPQLSHGDRCSQSSGHDLTSRRAGRGADTQAALETAQRYSQGRGKRRR